MDTSPPLLPPADPRLALDQALASAGIDGFEPTPEFLADCERVAQGTLSMAQALARALERARAASGNAG